MTLSLTESRPSEQPRTPVRSGRDFWAWGLLFSAGIFVLIITYAVEYRVTRGHISAALDDTYIHMRFAENLLAGQGFAFNPGEPTPGTTSPLWVLLLALGGLFTDNLLDVALFWSSFFYLALAVAAYGLGQRLLPGRGWALAFGLLCLFTGRIVWTAASGMEPTLFAALSLWAVTRYTDDRIDRGTACHAPTDLPRSRFSLFTALLFGLATNARPEGYLLFLCALLDAALGLRREDGRRTLAWKGFPWKAALLYLLLIAPYPLFSLATTGSLLPNTFHANSLYFRWGRSWEYLSLVLQFLPYDNLFLHLFLPVGAVGIVVQAWRKGTEALPPGRLLVFFWAVGYLPASTLLTPMKYHFQRYLIPLLPFFILLSLFGLEMALDFLARRRPAAVGRVRRAALAVMVAWGMALVVQWPGFLNRTAERIIGRPVRQWPSLVAQSVDNINGMQVAIGEWIRRGTRPEDVIAANDIGAIGYISKRRVLDVVGLVTPEILPYVKGLHINSLRDQRVLEFLSREKPEYLVVFPNWYPTLVEKRDLLYPVFAVELKDNIICGGDVMVVYKCRW
ncbi:MAG: hypothetical protein A2V67_02260 [Deltaproteobacteria bacterium RBG_13_61_14]|nr:MAG: hypothetical protein A2V67_02260 [Deltaproteobacteria bacterium RBG_13_61_14]